ncbi:DUF805 domain-containing protein [uncultured bacterium]|nr:DUF805 domain-containing protein [uncultured bacterium]
MSTRHVNLFKAYQLFWKNYFNFKGNSSRTEYWWPFMWNWLIRFVFLIWALVGHLKGEPHVELTGLVLLLAYCLVALIPCISITIRRYRNAGISVYWIFLTYVAPWVLQAIVHESVGKTWLRIIIENTSAFLEFICFICAIVLALFPTKHD